MAYVEKRVIAVYRITSRQSGKVYIGGSSNVFWRFYQHRNELKNGSHFISKMQKDFDSGSLLKFEIVEILTETSRLRLREQYWLNQHGGSRHKNCYNRNDVIPCSQWPEGWVQELYVTFFGDGKFA